MESTAIQILNNRGLRITNMKINILSLFLDSKKAYSLSDLETVFKDSCDRSTVFRILQVLTLHNILEQFSSTKGVSVYILHSQKNYCTDSNHYHFKCSDCENVTPLPQLPANYLAVLGNSSIKSLNLIVEGTCEECQNHQKMKNNRKEFIKNLLSFPLLGFSLPSADAKVINITEAQKMREGILQAISKSKDATLANIEQMPNDFFGYKYTPEAMSFAEQFRHCAVFTFSQFSGRLDFKNPFEGNKPKVLLNKVETIEITKLMYETILKWAKEISDEKLMDDIEYSGETIPAWRFFYVMENHIIHHRGQAIVYLRLKGITPKGYLGW